MYLYNISIIVEETQHDSLLGWLKTEWLPTLNNETKFLKMLNTPHEGHTYCIQMITDTDEEITLFQQTKLSDLQQYLLTNHNEKAFIFDSVMQYI